MVFTRHIFIILYEAVFTTLGAERKSYDVPLCTLDCKKGKVYQALCFYV